MAISEGLPQDLSDLNRIVLMGQSEDADVASALLGERPYVTPAITPQPWSPRARVTRVIRDACKTHASASHELDRAIDATCTLWGVTPRARVRDVDSRLLPLIAGFAHARATNASHVLLTDPLHGLTSSARTSLRNRILDTCKRLDLGLIMSTSSLTDAFVIGGWAIVVEKEQVADQGPIEAQLATPRSNLAAAHRRVNVFSGLARKGWLSIGHSQVRARTELDGKVFVTIPVNAVAMSFDEFDPVFTDETVFEALVTQVRDAGERVQVVLSPVDTEVGLAMTADLWDFSGQGQSSGSPVLHPALGDGVSEQATRVRAGSHVFVQVDTARMEAYPVEDAAPTAVK
ncbi:hypothetical protein HMPREF0183_0668 [Brevibacterium mcbrellneri ATCC 49030]|uniref:ABC transporter domain-containing protein n=1 Tax=Brevibacterium mcbrellneri ATCC 49030 TaxID=585530 RepID=D4YL58_9MICO|nr:hypothetical protein [Brevibacterium mcbrellneri]EFG48152.1 hypothetical protein HMPREF0183_0668 [Brevibacterium mcbrellneri ATCC 49030]